MEGKKKCRLVHRRLGDKIWKELPIIEVSVFSPEQATSLCLELDYATAPLPALSPGWSAAEPSAGTLSP